MQDEALVVAPFVQKLMLDGKTFVARRDPGFRSKVAIRATDDVERALACFAAPSFHSQAEAELVGEDLANFRMTVAQLLAHGLLVRVPMRTVAGPSIEVELTSRCNAHCVMCPRDALPDFSDMTAATFDGLLSLVTASGTGVSLQGIGEPTLHPRLVECVERLRSALPPDAPIMMVSNGFNLDPKKMGELLGAGVGLVQWSFHATSEALYNEIMGVKQYKRARRNLEECAREWSKHMSINVVVMDSNKEEIEPLRAYLGELGLAGDRVRLIPCFSRGGHLTTHLLRRNSPASGACTYVRKALFVAFDGSVLPCSNDFRRRHALGNVRENSAAQLLTRWRDDLLAQGVSYDICQKCDHFSRGGLPTAWFSQQRGLPIVSARKAT